MKRLKSAWIASGLAFLALLWAGSGPALAQVTVTPSATLTSPADGSSFLNFIYFDGITPDYYDVILIKGNASCSATGPANGSFTIDWNMWLKVDGSSLVPNNTSNGSVVRKFDAMGKWRQDFSPASQSWYSLQAGDHRAECSANTIYGTLHQSVTDRHYFTVTNFYFFP